MCKHILNTQAFVQAPCCLKWVECAECHDEISSHPFKHSARLKWCCKACRTCFTRDFKLFSERDKYCNQCGNCWVVPGVTPESRILEETALVLQHFANEILNPEQSFFTELEPS